MGLLPKGSAVDIYNASCLPTLSLADATAGGQANLTFFDAAQETSALQILSDLEFVRYLGEGATFTVELWKSSGENDKKKFVAVKSAKIRSLIARPETGHDHFLYTLMQEIQILRHGPIDEHKNVISILGYDWKRGPNSIPYPIVVVEYAEYGDLSEYLLLHPEITIERKSMLCLDIAKGLHVLHACKIAHGDIKLPNVLVAQAEGGTPIAKVSDFGHAIPEIDSNRRRSYLGTVLYIPPEASRETNLSFNELCQCDVFAYGLTVWEVLNSGKPYYVTFESAPTSNFKKPDNQPSSRQMSKAFATFIDSLFSLDEAAVKEKYREILCDTTFQASYLRCDIGTVLETLSSICNSPIKAAQNVIGAYDFRRTPMGHWSLQLDERTIPRAAQNQGVRDLHAACQASNPPEKGHLSLLLSYCYAHGYGVAADYVQVFDCFKLAAESGIISAESLLHQIYDGIASYMQGKQFRDKSFIPGGSEDELLEHVESLVRNSNRNNFIARILCWESCGTQIIRESDIEMLLPNGETILLTAEDLLLKAPSLGPMRDLQNIIVSVETRLGQVEVPLLIHAAQVGWIELLKILLRTAEAKELNHFFIYKDCQFTMLLAAVASGQVDTTKFLVSLGARVKSDPESDYWIVRCWNPLHCLFIFEAHVMNEMAKLFIMGGADPNAVVDPTFTIATFIGQEFPIELAGTPLDVSVRVGDVHSVRVLLEHGADPLSICPPTRSLQLHYPLHVAVALHLYDSVELMLNRLATDDRVHQANGNYGETPLHHVSGTIYSGKCLLQRWIMHGSNAFTAIRRTIEICQQFGLSIDARDNDGDTPLAVACMRGPAQVEVVSQLILCGADLTCTCDDGDGIFAKCSWNLIDDLDNAGAVPLLIQAGADINQQDRYAQTPAHRFAWTNATAALKELLRAGPNIRRGDEDDPTPLHFAVYHGNLAAVEALVAYENSQFINSEQQIFNTKADDHERSAEIAAGVESERSNRNTAEFFGSVLRSAVNGHYWGFSENLEVLLEKYRDLFCLPEVLQSMSKKGITSLQHAAMRDHQGTAQLLLLAGAEIDFSDPDGEWRRTATACAAESGAFRTLTYLLQSGASPYCRIEEFGRRDDSKEPRWSFLQEALYHIEENNLEHRIDELIMLTRYWLDHFDILNNHDMDGWTALHLATYQGSKTCVKALVEAGADPTAKIMDLSDDYECTGFVNCTVLEFAQKLKTEIRPARGGRVHEVNNWSERIEEIIAYLEGVRHDDR